MPPPNTAEATPSASATGSAEHPDLATREAIAASPDPLADVFGAPRSVEQTPADPDSGQAPPARSPRPDTPQPRGRDEHGRFAPAAHPETEGALRPGLRPVSGQPSPTTAPAHPADSGDDTATSPEDLGALPDLASLSEAQAQALLSQNPALKKALGLQVRQQLQRYQVEAQRANQQAQAEAQQRAYYQQQQQLEDQYAAAFADETHPDYWTAVDYFAQRGYAPIQGRALLQAPVVQQHVGQAQQVAYDRGTQDAVVAAASHPALADVAPDALESAWQESANPADFYERAFKAAGWVPPTQVEEWRAAIAAEERTRLFGGYQPTSPRDGDTPVPAGTRQRGWPANPAEINPDELFVQHFRQQESGSTGRGNGR